MTSLWSCKKQENKVTYEGGTAPVLAASSTAPLVLSPTNASQQAISFTWTNPNYRFNTGVSSQDVTYTLQVDTVGDNFKNAQSVSLTNDMTTSLTVKDLNALLTKLNIAEDMQHNIEFRLVSSLNNSNASISGVPLYSNSIQVKVTPYFDSAVPLSPTDMLYITGSAVASGWTNTPPPPQKMTPVTGATTSTGRPYAYTITINLSAGNQYKFLSTQNQWQPQYGATGTYDQNSGGNIGYNMGTGSDPDAINAPTAGGMHTVTVNLKTGKFTVN